LFKSSAAGALKSFSAAELTAVKRQSRSSTIKALRDAFEDGSGVLLSDFKCLFRATTFGDVTKYQDDSHEFASAVSDWRSTVVNGNPTATSRD
jgi:hypothetical protein